MSSVSSKYEKIIEQRSYLEEDIQIDFWDIKFREGLAWFLCLMACHPSLVFNFKAILVE